MSANNMREKLAQGLATRRRSVLNDEGLSRIQSSLSRSKLAMGSEKIFSVPVASIEDNPFQYRTIEGLDATDIASLATSISEHGLQEPLRLRRKDERLILVAGWRRLTAIKRHLKALTHVNAMIADNMDDATHRLLTIIENEQRADFTLFERAHAYQDLMSLDNKTMAEVAALVGSSKTRVSRAIKLLSLPLDLQQTLSAAVANGLSAGHADEICAGFDKRSSDPEAARQWVLEAIEQSLNHSVSIEGLRVQNRQSAEEGQSQEKTTGVTLSGKKKLKRWRIDGGEWQRFEVSTRNRVTLEFKLPTEISFSETGSIVRYIKNQLLKSPNDFKSQAILTGSEAEDLGEMGEGSDGISSGIEVQISDENS